MRQVSFLWAAGLALVAACHDKGSAPSPAPSASVAAPARPALPASPTYTTYRNARYAFSVDVPSFFTAPRSILDGAGQQWTWEMRAQMATAAVPAGSKSLGDWFEESRKGEGYASGSLGSSSFVGRGKANGKVYWQKTLLQDGMLYSVRLDYDEDLRAALEPVIAHIDGSLEGPAREGGAHP